MIPELERFIWSIALDFQIAREQLNLMKRMAKDRVKGERHAGRKD